MTVLSNLTGSAISGSRIIAAMPVFICSIRACQPALSSMGGNGSWAGRTMASDACASGLIDFGTGMVRAVRCTPFDPSMISPMLPVSLGREPIGTPPEMSMF